jgi:polar amino acid transport system substrate-binding protein
VELQSKRIGVVRGYINTKMFDLATYLDKHEATTDHINLKKLYFKRLDLIVIDKNVADHLIEKKQPRLQVIPGVHVPHPGRKTSLYCLF